MVRLFKTTSLLWLYSTITNTNTRREVKSLREKTKARLIPAWKIFEYFTARSHTHCAMYRFFITLIDPIGKYWVKLWESLF